MTRWLGGVIVTTLLLSTAEYAAEHRIAAAGGCGAVLLGETTVATLRNAPIVTLSANGVPVTLVLDTGAEGTILTPGRRPADRRATPSDRISKAAARNCRHPPDHRGGAAEL